MTFDFSYTPPRGPDRDECVRQAEEAVRIAEAGGYPGAVVDTQRAVRGTVDHRPEEPIPLPVPTGRRTRIRVLNATSLASGRRFAAEGVTPMILNFASARHPGGGFLNGARAQEESLCRASALYPCIARSPMYAHHGRQRDLLYTDWMIWSPDVPVFRDDETGALLAQPWHAAFLTAPAPNASAIRDHAPEPAPDIEGALRARAVRVLAIAALHRHTHLVLGAWGCGVFGNDPAVVADAFGACLDGPFAGVFEAVDFAVLDASPARTNLRPFVERFGQR